MAINTRSNSAKQFEKFLAALDVASYDENVLAVLMGMAPVVIQRRMLSLFVTYINHLSDFYCHGIDANDTAKRDLYEDAQVYKNALDSIRRR